MKFAWEKMLQPEPSSSLDTLEPYLRAANVFWEGVDISDIKEMWFSPYEKKLYELGPGDLMVCEGGDVGRSAIWKGNLQKLYIQNAIHRVRSKPDYSNKILYYWMITLKSAGYIDLLCNKATIAHLTAVKLNELPVIFPPPDEQPTIINFLDRETAKINALVAKKEGQIELLQEKRIALISQAVTKGLNPTVPMKDSGVEWLGQIPMHWDLKRLKNGFEVRLGKMLQPEPGTDNDTLEPYLRAANVFWEGIDVSDIKEMWLSPNEKNIYGIKSGDLIVCEGGDVGRSSLWDGKIYPCFIQNAVHRVRAKVNHSNKFLYYWMFILKTEGYIDLICSKATISHLTAIKLNELPLIHPPIDEQVKIIEYLDQEILKIDGLIAKIREGIDKLKEYRTTLIFAAVTGKIDVRRTGNS